MHSSRMRTARGSSRPRGGLPQCMLGYTTPPGVGLETPPRCGPRDSLVWAWRNPPGCGPGDPPGCGPGDPPGCGPGDPLGCGPEDPLPTSCGPGEPPARPLNFPPGVGLETPPETCKPCWDTTCKACWDTPPHPAVNRMADMCKNITLPQTSFAGSN